MNNFLRKGTGKVNPMLTLKQQFGYFTLEIISAQYLLFSNFQSFYWESWCWLVLLSLWNCLSLFKWNFHFWPEYLGALFHLESSFQIAHAYFMNVASFCVSLCILFLYFLLSSLLLFPLGSIFLFAPIIKAKFPLNVWVDIVHSHFKMKHFLKSPLEVLCGGDLYIQKGTWSFFGDLSWQYLYIFPLGMISLLRKDSSSLKPGDKPGQQCSPTKWQTRARRSHHLMRRLHLSIPCSAEMDSSLQHLFSLSRAPSF